ncbi:MAG: phosphate transport system regulatory protein PhoU [Chloroflexi bacterium HGW-Chloroflexi-6]|nr:MAG: phosphate transport system regulatory protein PhoU [Chloroflexi bacterium HGW-Chloroflexi-6]
MVRTTFEHEMQELKDEILILGSLAEQALLDSVTALKKRDLALSEKVILGDKTINEKRFELENRVMIVIATQQPMARDLRVLASILEVIGELERMGDYAKGIGVINLRMGSEPLLKPLVDMPRMAEQGVSMLHRALAAFVNEDAESARLIPAEDDLVDQLYVQIYRELMTFIVADPRSIEHANWLLWAAHNLERFADRVTNICERTEFVVTGQYKETQTSTNDLSG